MATLAHLLRAPQISLHPEWVPNPDATLRWVAASDLPDPTPFLEGGEVLLITGLGKDEWMLQQWEEYCARLSQAHVCAIGIALDITWKTVPDAAREACIALHVNLFSVPASTSFVSITRTVAELLREEELTGSRQWEQYQQLMIASAAQPSRIISHLEKALGMHVEYAPSTRSAITSSSRSSMSTSRTTPHGELVEIVARNTDFPHELRIYPSQTTNPYNLPRWKRRLITMAVTLLSLHVTTQAERLATIRAAHSHVWEVLSEGDIRLARAILATAHPGTPALSGENRVMVIRSKAQAHTSKSDIDDYHSVWNKILALPTTASAPAIAREYVAENGKDRALEVLFPPVLAPALTRIVEEAGCEAGIGILCTAQTIEKSRDAAWAALKTARPTDHVVWWEHMASRGLEAVADHHALRAFATDFLQPLTHAEKEEKLVDFLRMYIEENGNRSVIGMKLGMHRNTVRARVQRIEHLLGARLDDPGVRASAWVALHNLEA